MTPEERADLARLLVALASIAQHAPAHMRAGHLAPAAREWADKLRRER